MSILIGKVANKIGNNSEYYFVNSFPEYEEQMELKNDEPNMNDFFSGTIFLYGSQWNHCRGKDGYYNLYIYETIDVDKGYYLYRLERDMCMEILLLRPVVFGDLINSNNDKLLEANLQKTLPILDNPARVIVTNFGDVELNWRKNFSFKASNKELTQIVLSSDAFNNFVNSIDSPFSKNGEYVNERLYEGGIGDGIRKGLNNSVFITSILEKSITTKGGKDLVRNKVNKFLEDIANDTDKNLKISKINSNAFATSKLNGNYCITHKVDGISTTEENLRIEQIDLSGLTDIVPLNIYDLKEIEPKTDLGTGRKAGVFDIVDNKIPKSLFLAKIRRKGYIPIGAPRDRVPEVPREASGGFSGDIRAVRGYESEDGEDAKNPQKVKGNYGGRKGEFNLGYLDRVNFVAGPPTTSEFFLQRGLEAIYNPVGSIFNAIEFTQVQKNMKVLMENSFFLHPRLVPSEYPFLPEFTYDVPFGFLIFGLERLFGSWKLFKYTGDEVKKSITYFSGIKSNLIDEYGRSGEGWSKIDNKLANIQPTPEFTKFYLDNFNFTWLAFFPNANKEKVTRYPTWSEVDIGGTGKHTNNYQYKEKTIVSDIFDIEGKEVKKLNPYSNDRFPADRARVDSNLRRLLLRSSIDLPESLTLEKGDYFFNDLEYEILEYPEKDRFQGLRKIAEYTGHGDSASLGRSRVREMNPRVFLIEDFLRVPGSRILNVIPDSPIVGLFTTPEGGLDIRSIHTFEKELTLNTSEDQIVDSVDDQKRRVVKFTLIKKIVEDFRKPNFKEFRDQERVKIIHAFYKAHGYKTKISGGVAHGIGFDEEDLSEGSDEQLLFDLVGTRGYAFIAKGKVSLISKDEKLFKIQLTNTTTLLHSENKDLEVSLIEKINQKVRFHFLNAPYYLKGRSSFTDGDKILLSFETIQPTQQQTQFEQYFINLKTEYDHIYWENISVPKKQTKALSVADSIQLEQLNLDLARAKYGYQIDTDQHKLATDRFQENIRRAEIDLTHSKIQSIFSAFSNLFKGGATASIIGHYAGEKTTVRTIKQGGYQGRHDEFNPITLAKMPGFVSLPTKTTKITTKPGKFPNIGAGAIGYGLNQVGDLLYKGGLKFPEAQRRIDFDQQQGAAQLALQSLVFNQDFMERQRNDLLALNQLTNSYNNPLINEREIMDSFMEKKDWHGGKKLKPAYIISFIPSDEQLLLLRSYKDEYGVMCEIPDVRMEFYEGMEPDIVRFRHLDDNSIKGITNALVREGFKSRLLAGIKIVKTSTTTYQLLTSDDYKEKIFRLNTDLIKKVEESEVKDREIITLTGRINTIRDEVKEECAQKETELQKRIREIEEQVNEVNRQLRERIEECDRAKANFEAGDKVSREKIKELEDEVHKFKVKSEELEQELADSRRREINEQDEINKLKKQLSDKQKELDEAKKAAPSKPAQPTPPDEDCQLMLTMLNDQYSYELKIRENGGSAFLDLVFELATAIKGEGRAQIDQRLMKVREIHTIIELLEELKNFSVVDLAIDTVQEPGGNKYVEGMEKGGQKNGEVDKVIAKFARMKDMETKLNAKALKAILDELNYQVYRFKRDYGEKHKDNQDVQFLFKHVYPGKALDLYKALYGDPNIAISRKRYFDEVKCVAEGGQSTVSILKQYEKEVKQTFTGTSPKEAPSEKPERPEIDEPDLIPHDEDDITFYGLPIGLPKSINKYLNDGFIKGFAASDVFADFEDKYFRENSSINNVAFFGAALESYYGRYLKMDPSKADGFGAANSDGTGSSKKNAGNKYKLAHIGVRAGKNGFSNKYINLAGFKAKKYEQIYMNVHELIIRRNEITVDQDYYRKVLSGEIEISIRTNAIIADEPKFSAYTTKIPLGTIRQLHNKNLLEEFIKFLYIFDRNRLEIVDWAYDYSDSGRVAQAYYAIGADIDKHYKNIGAENNDRKDKFTIGFIYSDLPTFGVQGDLVYYESIGGGIVSSHRFQGKYTGYISKNGSVGDIPRDPKFQVLKFMRYFYLYVIDKEDAVYHPGMLASGDTKPVIGFLVSLNKLANY